MAEILVHCDTCHRDINADLVHRVHLDEAL